MESIKVLLVDDNATFLRAAMLTLSAIARVNIVGTARSGAAALTIALVKHPDLVLMDVNMPVMDGVEAAWRMRADGVKARIVFVSMDDEPVERASKLNVRADGFVLKTDFATAVRHAIDRLFPRDVTGCSS